MPALNDRENRAVEEFFVRNPDLTGCRDALLMLNERLVETIDSGGKILVCGNGGSQADAMHIVGELCNRFELKRPLSKEFRNRLKDLPFAEILQERLGRGLPAVALGCNVALSSAVENDSGNCGIAYAQEAYALLTPKDILLAISTSGNARNCLMAVSVAKALGANTAVLTGPNGGALGTVADVVIRAPGESTKAIQEAHERIYHLFCMLLELHFFAGKD